MKLRAFVLDDEPLAVKRLVRLLNESGRVQVVGHATDAVEAVDAIAGTPLDILFLDIQMPGLNGFELLARLNPQPLVVFTTAYEQYSLKAFEVHSIDYLLKPIEDQALERSLNKLERLLGRATARPEASAVLAQVEALLRERAPQFPERLPSRQGDKVEFVDLSQVSHFYAQDKLTFAATARKNFVLDFTISELEERLDPQRFLRIHRSTLVQLSYVQELYTWFAGRIMVRLKDEHETELTVARDRVRALKDRLGV